MGGYAEISQRGKAAVENVQRSTSDVRRRSCGGSALPCSVLAGCMLPPLLGLVITHAERARVPKGRLRSNPTAHPSVVPSGLVCHARCFPAFKRRDRKSTRLNSSH